MRVGTFHEGYLAGCKDTTEVATKLTEKITKDLIDAQTQALSNWIGFQPCVYLNQLAKEKPEYIGTWYTMGKILRERQLSGNYDLTRSECLNGVEQQLVFEAFDYLISQGQLESFFTVHLQDKGDERGTRLPGSWASKDDIPKLVLDEDGTKHSILTLDVYQWYTPKWIAYESLSPAA